MAVNNPINFFLINPNMIFYHVSFMKNLWVSKTSLVLIGAKSTEKKITLPFNPDFFILLTVKVFEILPEIFQSLLL